MQKTISDNGNGGRLIDSVRRAGPEVDELLQKMTDEITALIGAQRGALLPADTYQDLFPSALAGAGIVRLEEAREPTYLAVPVRSTRGQLVGGLVFVHSERDYFIERQERWLAILASHVALAIDNAELRQRLRENEEAQAYREREASRLEAERERLANELTDRTRTSESLAGVLAHDLRNPLGAILAGADLLIRRGELTDVQAKILGRVHSAGERAARMIDDLLDFTQARLGSGLKLHRCPTDLAKIARQAVEEIKAAHAGRRIQFEAHGKLNGDWDEERIAQVVSNLLRNALAHSPDDSVISVSTSARNEHVVASVHNLGMPLSEDALSRIFEPFRNGERRPNRSIKSLGLSLYIVRQIVAGHGGRIEVHSTDQTGTTFTIYLPRSASIDER